MKNQFRVSRSKDVCKLFDFAEEYLKKNGVLDGDGKLRKFAICEFRPTMLPSDYPDEVIVHFKFGCICPFSGGRIKDRNLAETVRRVVNSEEGLKWKQVFESKLKHWHQLCHTVVELSGGFFDWPNYKRYPAYLNFEHSCRICSIEPHGGFWIPESECITEEFIANQERQARRENKKIEKLDRAFRALRERKQLEEIGRTFRAAGISNNP